MNPPPERDMTDRNLKRLLGAARYDVDRSCADFLRRLKPAPRSWNWLQVAAALLLGAVLVWAIFPPTENSTVPAGAQDQGELKDRIARLEAALKTADGEPERARIQASLDDLRRRLGENKKPVELEKKGPGRFEELTKAIEANPRDPDLYAARAEEAVWTKRWAEGEQDARKAIELSPRHGRAHCALGRALFYLRRVEESKAAFAKAVEIDPKLADIARIDPVEERSYRMRDEIMDVYGRIKMSKDPGERVTLEKQVQEMEKELQRIEQGGARPADMKEIESRLKANPDDLVALVDRARARLDAGQAADALKDLDRAIEMKPGWADPWLVRSMAHALAGNAEKSGQDLKRGIELDPKNKAIEAATMAYKKAWAADKERARPPEEIRRRIDALVERLEELRALERTANLPAADRDRAREEAKRVEAEIDALKKRAEGK